MGGCLCCQMQEELEYVQRPNVRNRVFHRCFSLLVACFHSSEEQDIVPSHSALPSAFAALLESVPDVYHAPPRPLPFDAEVGPCSLRTGKNSECTVSYRLSTSGGIDITCGKDDDDCANKKTEDEKATPKSNARVDLSSIVDDEDVCPICLEEYDSENPKINTKCNHHFHLGCIFEWQERSNSCPLCGKEMVFTETP